jgi:TonB family protein
MTSGSRRPTLPATALPAAAMVAALVAALFAGCRPVTSPPMASFPARASLECFVPSPDDYAVTIVVPDTTFQDSAWLRPMLGDIGRFWPVSLPLPKHALDVSFTFHRDGTSSKPRITKHSNAGAFDDRALRAVIAAVSDTSRRLPESFHSDSLPLIVRFGSTDFTGALVQTWYSVARPPKPRRGNPQPNFPKERQRGEQVIAAFTVDSLGNVDASSIEIVSATNDDFANAVVEVLPKWKFTPSTIRGCRVARSIRWEFGEMP